MRHVLILFDTRVTHRRSGPAISGQQTGQGTIWGFYVPSFPPSLLLSPSLPRKGAGGEHNKFSVSDVEVGEQ